MRSVFTTWREVVEPFTTPRSPAPAPCCRRALFVCLGLQVLRGRGEGGVLLPPLPKLLPSLARAVLPL